MLCRFFLLRSYIISSTISRVHCLFIYTPKPIICIEKRQNSSQSALNHSVSELHHKSCTFHTAIEERLVQREVEVTRLRLQRTDFLLFSIVKRLSDQQRDNTNWLIATDKLRFYIWHLNGIALAFRWL